MGLDLIAVSDHNSTGNLKAFGEALDRFGQGEISGLYGTEVQTREEVHLLCLFDELNRATAFGKFVQENLPAVENREEIFGSQPLVDAEDKIVGKEDRLLLNSLAVGLEEVAERVERGKGLPIPAHVCRPAFGLLEQLGFFPRQFPALELGPETVKEGRERLKGKFPSVLGEALVGFSDAHRPEQIGRVFTELQLEKGTISELRRAFRKERGRRILGIKSSEGTVF